VRIMTCFTKLAILYLIASLLAVSIIGAVQFRRVATPIARDMTVAWFASIMAGPKVPAEIDVDDNELLLTWDTQSNSKAIIHMAYEIVPFFAVERVSDASHYPAVILVVPLVAETSFVIAGQAGKTPNGPMVRINERFLDDRAGLLATLTHELIHLQGGYFLDPPEGIEGLDRSYFIESRTSTATLEVLAAMCRYGNPVACQAFWGDLEVLARRSLQAKAGRAGLLGLYEWWASAFLRDDAGDLRGEKMDRFWEGNRTEQQQIIERYGELPWEEQVLPGICGQPLITGTLRQIDTFEGRPVMLVLAMPFDDTREMLGFPLGQWLCSLRQPGGAHQ